MHSNQQLAHSTLCYSSSKIWLLSNIKQEALVSTCIQIRTCFFVHTSILVHVIVLRFYWTDILFLSYVNISKSFTFSQSVTVKDLPEDNCVTSTMDNILLTWIGNAVYYALKLVTQSLLRDITMIYYRNCAKNCSKTSQDAAQAPHDYHYLIKYNQCIV